MMGWQVRGWKRVAATGGVLLFHLAFPIALVVMCHTYLDRVSTPAEKLSLWIVLLPILVVLGFFVVAGVRALNMRKEGNGKKGGGVLSRLILLCCAVFWVNVCLSAPPSLTAQPMPTQVYHALSPLLSYEFISRSFFIWGGVAT